MATSTRIPVLVLVTGAVLCLVGCGGGVAEFTGGSNSKDKQPIPSAVQASAGQPAAAVQADGQEAASATPAVEDPAVAVKVEEKKSAKEAEELRARSQQYRAGRNRDPFLSLIGGDERTDVVDLSVVRLVGVVTSGEKPFAVVEDAEGTSYVLRKGDRVKNGRVVSIKTDALVCSQTVLGYTTTVQLKLEGKDVKHG